MIDFTPDIRPYGKTHFLINPDGAQIYQCFLNLSNELKRRLNIQLQEPMLLDYALQRHWVIISLDRLSSTSWMEQRFAANVKVLDATYGKFPRSYERTTALLKLFEHTVVKGDLETELEIYHVKNNEVSIRERHLSSSAEFARLFVHQFT